MSCDIWVGVIGSPVCDLNACPSAVMILAAAGGVELGVDMMRNDEELEDEYSVVARRW